MRYSFFRYLVLVSACFGLLLEANAQITWRRTYGGFGADNARSVGQTADGGYIVAGTAGSFGNGSSDIYVLRLDENGEHLWSRTYGGPGVEQGVACREVTDGFVIAGWTSLGEHGSYDLLLIRTDASGTVLWQKQYGTVDWDLCNAFDVLPDGFVLGGISYGPDTPQGSAYVVRTDLNGDVLWSRTYGDDQRWECNGVIGTSDLGLAIVGAAGSGSGDDAFLMKLDAGGAEQWTTIAGGDSADLFTSVLERPDGHWVACGNTHSWEAFQQIYLAGFQPGGEPEWERQIGGTSDSGGAEVRPAHGAGYVLTGYNTLNLGDRDMIITTTDVDGYFTAGNNFGDSRPADGYSVSTTADGGYVVAGWSQEYGPGQRSVYVVKTDSALQTATLAVQTYFDPLSVAEDRSQVTTRFAPNPAAPGSIVHWGNEGLHPVDLLITDVQGRMVSASRLSSVDVSFQVPDLPAGSYRVRLIAADGRVLNGALEVQR